VLLHPGVIDLGDGILKATHDQARFIDVEQKAILREVLQDIFFQRYIERRVM
jgi:hypothetical protein